MKSTVTMLSNVSKINYDLQDNRLMSKLVRIENVIRKRFNIKSKLKDIECYTSQTNFIFNNYEVVLLVDKYYK